MEALATGEVLRGRVILECVTQSADGETHHNSIDLVDATIPSIRPEMLFDGDSTRTLSAGPVLIEEIGYTDEAVEHRGPGRQGGHMTVIWDPEAGTESDLEARG